MPMVLAMNGAEFGASQSVADLQSALVALGKGIGDPTLMKIAVDGAMGPKTAAATNRALTVHLGSGQAPANLRTGTLSQAVITSQVAQITQLIEAEITRRGFSLPTSKKITAKKVSVPAYVPPPAPAAVAPVYKVPAAVPAAAGSAMGSVMMWAAIGVGVVALGGVAYYFATRKKSASGGLRARTGVPGGALSGSGFHHTRAKEFQVGQRVQLHPGTNSWMRGDRYATVTKVGKSRVHVTTDHGSKLSLVPSRLQIEE